MKKLLFSIMVLALVCVSATFAYQNYINETDETMAVDADDDTMDISGYSVESVGDAVTSIDAFDGESWFVLQVGGTGRTGYGYYDEDYADFYNGAVTDLTELAPGEVQNYLFLVIPNEDGTFSLYNGAGYYLAVNPSSWDCYATEELDVYSTFNIAQIDADTDETIWYLAEATGGTILDTNPVGYTMAGWDTTVPTSTTGNNAMTFLPATVVYDAEALYEVLAAELAEAQESLDEATETIASYVNVAVHYEDALAELQAYLDEQSEEITTAYEAGELSHTATVETASVLETLEELLAAAAEAQADYEADHTDPTDLSGLFIGSVGDAVTSTDGFDGASWYILQVGGTGRTGYGYYDEDNADFYNGAVTDLTGVYTTECAQYLFLVIPNEDGTFSLYNGAGYYLAVDPDSWDCYATEELDEYSTFNISQIDADTDETVWYLAEATGGTILDTNPVGYTMAGWDTTVPTSTTGNNAMKFLPVYFSEPSVYYYTYTVDMDNGSFTSSNAAGTYASVWESTLTDPTLTLSTTNKPNNMGYNDEGIDLYSGSTKQSIYVLDASWGYGIVSYTFKFYDLNSAGGITLTIDGTEYEVTDEEQEVTVEVGGVQVTRFTVSGTNNAVHCYDFTVELCSVNDPYEDTDEKVVDIDWGWGTATSVYSNSGDYIATWTSCREEPQLTFTNSDYCILNSTSGLNLTSDGGTEIFTLAAPTGYLITDYTLTIANAESSEETVTLTINDEDYEVTDEAQTISESGLSESALYFYLAGDEHEVHVSDFTATVVAYEDYFIVDMDHGVFTASNSAGTYASAWASNQETPQLTFTTGANNMADTDEGMLIYSGSAGSSTYSLTVPSGWLIDDYSFYFLQDEGYSADITITVDETTYDVTNDTTFVEVTDVASRTASFTIDGDNSPVRLLEFIVNISKGEAETEGGIVYLFVTDASSTYPYRIPAIARAYNGDLIAISDYRICGSDIGYGQVDLHYRISEDNGATWGKEQVLVEGSGTSGAVDCGFGDAAIVADSESDEVLLICVCGNVVYSSATRTNPNRVARFRSYDNGATWSEYEEITEDIYTLFDDSALGEVSGLFFGSGRICQSRQVKVGDYYRLYAALCARPNGNRVVYSDDFGETWQSLGTIDKSPASDGDEPKCEELPDGSVILSSRCTGGRYYNIYTYTDVETAEGSWGSVALSSADSDGVAAESNSTNGEILILPVIRNSDSETTYLALQSVPFGSGRANVGIYYKELTSKETDWDTPTLLAADWDGSYQVSTLGSAYSTMVPQADGNIAFYYEESTYGYSYTNVYLPLSLETITDSAYTYNPEQTPAEYVGAILEGLFADALTSEPGDAIGMINADAYDDTVAELEAIVEEYKENPVAAQYLEAVAAIEEALADVVNQLENEGIYTLLNKAYPEYYLSTSDVAGNLHTEKYTYEGASEVSDATEFIFMASDDDSWYIVNEAAGTYIGRCLAAAKYVEQQDADNIGYYTVVSGLDGWSYLKCTKPASAAKPALGLTEDNHVQPLAIDDEAALWQIVPTGEVATGIDSIVVDAEDASTNNVYYDLSGRIVKKPTQGIYIVNGKKVILK